MNLASPGVNTIYELEMRSVDEFRPRNAAVEEWSFAAIDPPLAAFNRFLFTLIGAEHGWSHREHWRREQWEHFFGRSEMQTFVGCVRGTPVAYAELESCGGGSIRILTLGVVPDFIGRGFGGMMLSEVVAYAWRKRPSRLWLTTCSHDHAHALPNYLARGFRVVQQTAGPPNAPAKSFWDLK
jgi:GNAT superfamily N-acetyltransferase